MCLATGFAAYTRDKILDLVQTLGLSYVKLDLSVLTSAYETNVSKSGCYALGHPGHKDRAESFIAIYEALFKVFDELHERVPGLYIDCTFETAGKLQLIDYAFCKHAEGNWLTNIEDPFPADAYRIRDLAWWKCPVIPASSLIIGNMAIDSPNFNEEMKTLMGTFPILLGDPRKVDKPGQLAIKRWAGWFDHMEKIYDCSHYRQDLPGFSEPTERSWDAWARLNTDTGLGGMVGVFCQGSPDHVHSLIVPGLTATSLYDVLSAPYGTKVGTLSGSALAETGIQVKAVKSYEGLIFEIRKH